MSLTVEEVRVECLKLAIQNKPYPTNVDKIIEDANQFLKFLEDQYPEQSDSTENKE